MKQNYTTADAAIWRNAARGGCIPQPEHTGDDADILANEQTISSRWRANFGGGRMTLVNSPEVALETQNNSRRGPGYDARIARSSQGESREDPNGDLQERGRKRE